MGWRRWDVLGATVIALALVTAGCGSGGVDDAGSAATTVAPSTTTEPVPDTTVVSDEQAVLAAYQGYWDTWLVANDPPDPGHPDLERYATGAALAKLTESIAQNRSVGQLLRLPPASISEHRAFVEHVDGATAVLVDCSIDDGLVVDYGSGRVLNDLVVTWRYEVVLVDSGGWRVSELRVIDRTEGISGCAA